MNSNTAQRWGTLLSYHMSLKCTVMNNILSWPKSLGFSIRFYNILQITNPMYYKWLVILLSDFKFTSWYWFWSACKYANYSPDLIIVASIALVSSKGKSWESQMHSLFKLEIQRIMCDNSAISSTNMRITGLGFAEAKMLIFLFKNIRKWNNWTWPDLCELF